MKETKCIFGFVMIALIIPFTCYGQTWSRTYGSTYPEVPTSVRQTQDGGYIVAGSTSSTGVGYVDYSDVLLLRLNSDGTISWHHRYGGDGKTDWASCVQQTGDGGYVVVGTKGGAIGCFLKGDFWVLKLNSDGSIAWQKRYGTAETLIFYAAKSIQQTDDGGYIAAGHKEDRIQDCYVAWISRLDSSGNIVWYKENTDKSSARCVQQIEDGGFIVAGNAKVEGGSNYYDFWVVKLDSGGNVIWQKTYGGDHGDYANSIRQTFDQQGDPDGYIVAGYTYSAGAWILKLDLYGSIEWQKAYGIDSEEANSIQQTQDGGYIVAGDTDSFGAGENDSWILKLDGDGNIIWQKTYGTHRSDFAQSIQQTDDSGYIIAGATGFWESSEGDRDFWVLKLDADGEIPDCGIMPTSDVTVVNTSVQGQDYTPEYLSTFLSTHNTEVIPEDTSTETSMLCPRPEPVCECQLNPDTTGIPMGETMGFDIAVTNNTDEVQVFGFATYVTKPNGGRYPPSGYLIGPVKVSLDPYGSRSAHRSHPIPGNAQLGTYTYHGVVGTLGAGPYDECQFEFEVTVP